jgi:queuine tRNA-ribosyltransferase
LLAYRLNAVHNLFYYHSLVRGIRQAIAEDTIDQFTRKFFSQKEAHTRIEGGETVC